VACDGLILASESMGMTIFGVSAFEQTHIKHPGAPARVARQEKELTRSCRVHVAGWAGNALTRGAQ
jgi:hypothetical protein